MSDAVVSVYEVDPSGSFRLLTANVPYKNLQWTRRLSTCGDFSAQLVGDAPFPWPGRYLVSRSDRPEVGVVEKMEYEEEEGGKVTVSGRFAECLLDRRRFGFAGAEVRGADWRQAVAAAFASWPMGDAPEIVLGDGLDATGSSYALRADARTSAMEAVYAVTAAKSAYPALSLDWERGTLVLSVPQGVDRTAGQSDRPAVEFSLLMGTAAKVEYAGDYSVACSSVIAYVADGAREAAAVEVSVDVPGFDPATMWEATASEDVYSLCSDAPTDDEAADAGLLRAYDHMPALSADVSVLGQGYGSAWDLGDTCDVVVPQAQVSCSARIEEVREVIKKGRSTIEVQIGPKSFSKVSRAMVRLR